MLAISFTIGRETKAFICIVGENLFANYIHSEDMPGSKRTSLNIADLLRKGPLDFVKMASPSFCDGIDQSSSLPNPMQDDFQMKSAMSPFQKMGQKDYFNKMLAICLKEFPESKGRPLPVIMPPGKIVDLYDLSISVKKGGGFDSVTSNHMWSSISVDLGFGPEIGPALKLVYSKHLKLFEKWMQTTDDIQENGLNSDDHAVKSNERKSPVTRKEAIIQSSNGSPCDVTGQMESSIVIADDEQVSNVQNVPDDNRKSGDLKRKYVELNDALEWLRNVAKNPCKIVSKDYEQWFQEHSNRFIGIRKLLFERLPFSNAENGSNSQKRIKVHPSMYNDTVPVNPEMLKKLRARSHDKRSSNPLIPALAPSATPESPLETTTANQAKTRGIVAAAAASNSARSSLKRHCIQYLDRATRKRTALGTLHQAVIPSMPNAAELQQSQVLDQREIRYLGTVESSPTSGNISSADRDRAGKGRAEENCTCEFPGSVDCVREHIQQERARLIAEMGPLFNAWKFDEMGEHVAKSWSMEEKQRFRAIVRLNPASLGQDFWKELPTAFPCRSRRELVSFYFNVFVLRRRSIQNRVVPDQIDSDDDEAEYSMSENLGMNKSYNQFGETPLLTEVCQENKQCTIDLEEGTSAKQRRTIIIWL